jgi:hypothetical protein
VDRKPHRNPLGPATPRIRPPTGHRPTSPAVRPLTRPANAAEPGTAPAGQAAPTIVDHGHHRSPLREGWPLLEKAGFRLGIGHPILKNLPQPGARPAPRPGRTSPRRASQPFAIRSARVARTTPGRHRRPCVPRAEGRQHRALLPWDSPHPQKAGSEGHFAHPTPNYFPPKINRLPGQHATDPARRVRLKSCRGGRAGWEAVYGVMIRAWPRSSCRPALPSPLSPTAGRHTCPTSISADELGATPTRQGAR